MTIKRTCCKAEEFGWCQDLNAEIKVDGKRYCIFHAPAEHNFLDNRPISVEEFNALVFERIDAVIALGDKAEEKPLKKNHWIKVACDLSGTVFPGDVSFSHYGEDKPLPSISFHAATFSGDADFRQTQFSGGHAYFREAQFTRGDANFRGAQFSGKVNFTMAVFHEGYAYFGDTQFGKKAVTFEGAEFRKESAIFRNANFSKVAPDFSGAVFGKRVSLRDATLLGLKFSSVRVEEKAYFSSLQCGRANFDKTEFNGVMDCTQSVFKGPVTMRRALFHKPAYFDQTVFHEGLDASNAVFKEYVKFEETSLLCYNYFEGTFFENWAYFNNPEFEHVNFKGSITKETIVIDRANLSGVPFKGMNIESFRFNVCEWKPDPTRSDLSVVCDHDSVPHDRLEEIYRRLKVTAREGGDQMMASNWHYQEKEACRKKHQEKGFLTKPLLNIIFSIYRAFSGYGERHVLACGVLCLLLILSGQILTYGGGKLPSGVSIQGVDFSMSMDSLDRLIRATTQVFKSVLPFKKTGPPEFLGGPLQALAYVLLTRLFIPIQAALALFALRNKFRR